MIPSARKYVFLRSVIWEKAEPGDTGDCQGVPLGTWSSTKVGREHNDPGVRFRKFLGVEHRRYSAVATAKIQRSCLRGRWQEGRVLICQALEIGSEVLQVSTSPEAS